MADAALALSQKAELTFKHNTKLGRHGWLRLTPAYSVKIVDEILDRHDDHSPVLEPFSGTGTTALCAAYHGHTAIAVDVNPFLVWFGQAKVAHYDTRALAEARNAAQLATPERLRARAWARNHPRSSTSSAGGMHIHSVSSAH